MNTDEEIFQTAAALTAAERPAYLDLACAGQPKIRAGVEALLRSHDAPGFMEAGMTGARCPNPAENGGRSREEPRSGERIGRYRLVQEIGHGGFGIVYAAEQKEPVRRRVALKVLKRGMDTREIVTRFAMERQALALMDHQNVAMVFDGGETEDGRPYFVMEYVDGIPITTFCDNHRRSINERIELMIQVCRGLQHAHQKGLIHCDIKPANILVMMQDGHAIPKLIDFGIAKATTYLTIGTLIEDPQKWAGTPVYMSPEQLRRDTLDVDVRTDIYSSGALLYELLTGLTPFDHKQLLAEGFGRLEQTIREEDPAKPSARLAAEKENLNKIAANRSTTPARLKSSLRSELDWIVMRAMEKNRERRYQSALELADDLSRYLKGEPVKAGPPTMRYRASKFSRRHSGRLAAAAIVLLLAVGMITYHLHSKRRTEEELAVDMLTGKDARTGLLSISLAKIRPHRNRVADQLAEFALDEKNNPRARLHAAIAVLPQKAKPEVLQVLTQGLLALNPTDPQASEDLEAVLVILRAYWEDDELDQEIWKNLKTSAWAVVEKRINSGDSGVNDEASENTAPLAAVALLAKLDPKHPDWQANSLLQKAVGWAWSSRARGLAQFRQFFDKVVEPVIFDDPVLRAGMIKEIGGEDGEVLDYDVLTLREFKSQSKGGGGIVSIKELKMAVNIEGMDLDDNEIEDIAPLAAMTKLKELDLADNRVSDIGPLEGLVRLESLDLRGKENQITDLSPLRKLPALEELQLNKNDLGKLGDLTAVFIELKALKILEMEDCNLTDISFVANLPNLERLEIRDNKVSDLTPLKRLKHLKVLDLKRNAITDPLPLLELAESGVEIQIDGNLFDEEKREEFEKAVEAGNKKAREKANKKASETPNKKPEEAPAAGEPARDQGSNEQEPK